MSLEATKGSSKERRFDYHRGRTPRRDKERNGSGSPWRSLREEAQGLLTGKRTRLEEVEKEATLKYHETIPE